MKNYGQYSLSKIKYDPNENDIINKIKYDPNENDIINKRSLPLYDDMMEL